MTRPSFSSCPSGTPSLRMPASYFSVSHSAVASARSASYAALSRRTLLNLLLGLAVVHVHEEVVAAGVLEVAVRLKHKVEPVRQIRNLKLGVGEVVRVAAGVGIIAVSHSSIFQSLKPAMKRTLCFPRSVSERLLFT